MVSRSEETTRKALGEKLRKAREKLRLTQAEVADKAGIHTNYYARIERGEENPSFDNLQAIMKVLKIRSIGVL